MINRDDIRETQMDALSIFLMGFRVFLEGERKLFSLF